MTRPFDDAAPADHYKVPAEPMRADNLGVLSPSEVAIDPRQRTVHVREGGDRERVPPMNNLAAHGLLCHSGTWPT